MTTVITDKGLNTIQKLAFDPNYTAIKNFQIGRSGDPVNTSQTDLLDKITGWYLGTSYKPYTTNVSDNLATITAVVETGEANEEIIREMGIFGNPSDIITRTQHLPINKNSQLRLIYKITFKVERV